MDARQPSGEGKGRAMTERAEFIARMEASEITPTWATIYDLNAVVERLRADLATAERERDRLRKAAVDQNHQIEQTLGAALGYPRYCDDLETFPEATEADGVCVGDLVAETLAEEAAALIARYRAALSRIPDCRCVGAARMIARKALIAPTNDGEEK